MNYERKKLKMELSSLKSSALSKIILKKLKGKDQPKRRYLQSMYMTKILAWSIYFLYFNNVNI